MGSMGFHASAFERISMTTLRMDDATRMSYNVTLRSDPVDARSDASAGLKWTELIESAPHANSCVGVERDGSHTCTLEPHVANSFCDQ